MTLFAPARGCPSVHRLFAFILSLGLALAAGWPQAAFAALLSCRTDPLVLLSNGTSVQMTAIIETEAAKIEKVIYVLHAPRGTSVAQVIYMGPLRDKEQLVFYADANENQYWTETVVQTAQARVPVQAVTRLQQGVVGSAVGLSGRPILVSLQVGLGY
jgi:hypothetical protein